MTHENRPAKAIMTDALIDSQRSLVHRVISSSTFGKSERLSTFLTCVCELTFTGQASLINEQKIGIAVFGRKPDYDSTVDGIVRTQASRLRQRLNLYFSAEGAGEPIQIVLPRGTYIPRFEPRITTPIAPSGESQPVPDPVETRPGSAAVSLPPTTSRLPGPVWFLTGALTLCLVALGFYSGGLKAGSASVSRQLSKQHPIWRSLFLEGRPTLIVPGDSGLVLFESSSKRSTNLSSYIRGNYGGEQSPPDLAQAVRLDGARYRYTSIVDLQIAATLSRVAADLGSSLSVRYARDVRPNDLKSSNAILVGAAQANPWVELYEQHMKFVLHNDTNANVFSVLNRSPLPGEPLQWHSAQDDPQRPVFGVVAFLPNVTGDGEVLILEGTSMAGTEAAWDFVTDNAKLASFLSRLHQQDGHPRHFEVLIGTNNMGASAVETSILAYRAEK